MSRTRLLSLFGVFCLVVPLLFVPLTGATVTLTVNEFETRVLFEDKQTVVSLVVDNPLPQPTSAIIRVELVDPDNIVRAFGDSEKTLNRDTNTVRIPVSFLAFKDKDPATEDLVWYRLRYRLTSKSIAFDQVAGVIALGKIAPNIFRLQVFAANFAHERSVYRVRVRAEHPLTATPVANVMVAGAVRFEDVELTQEQETGRDGYATLDFKLPGNLELDEGELNITGRRGLLFRKVESEVEISHRVFGVVSTDKPLYQPGQKLLIRLLFFDSTRQAIANAEATLKISNPEGEEVFRTTVTTSRFGVASTEWTIPEGTRLGSYHLKAGLEESNYEDAGAEASVKISRYDLPNFSVDVQPDRNYYTPGQDAVVTVRADYLFGKPVKRGHVRIVRELERSWDYGEQKWKVEEAETYEGNLDTEGKFVAHVGLKAEHEDLADEDYSRFHDLSYAAYFTDPTTNRTEQRRFDLRVTKEPIHVYVVDQQYQQKAFPLEFYVTTFYADGSPAECEVTIAEQLKGGRSLRTIRTNRFGLAKVSDLVWAANAEVAHDELLKFVARDSRGNTGKHTEDFYFRDTAPIRVKTDKIFYRPGEPVRVGITSSKPDLRVVVEAVRDWRIIRSEVVQLSHGKGSVVLPYHSEFTDDLTIAVYSPADAAESSYNFPYGWRTVIYPRNRDLDLQIALDRTTYRPGEEANIDFITRSADGKLSESSLGVVIFDKAVEERARTDRDLGGTYGFYGAYAYLRGESDMIAGVTRKDLDRVNIDKPLPDGFELVAEMLLNNNSYTPRLLLSDESERHASRVFAKLIEQQLRPLKLTLDAVYGKHAVYPKNEGTLVRLLSAEDIQLDELRDPWEQPYRIAFVVEGAADVLLLTSSGADKVASSDDDFTALRLAWPYFRFTGEAINRAIVAHHARTSGYIRDEATLKSELLRNGIDLAAVRDPWNQPYHFEFHTNRTEYSLHVFTGGENQQFKVRAKQDSDNSQVWQTGIDYSADIKLRIQAALTRYFGAASLFPQTEEEFSKALADSGIDRNELRDPWGQLLYATFAVESVYNDRVQLIAQAKYGEPVQQRTVVTPVTETIKSIKLRSSGPDGNEGTHDDFDIGKFWRITAEEDRTEKTLQQTAGYVPMQGATGAITGTVLDFNGAAVPGASVKAVNKTNSTERQVTTNDSGVYLIKNLSVGLYEVTFDAAGFRRTVITDVVVRSSSVVELNATLDPGAVSETVTVMSGLVDMSTNASNAAFSMSSSKVVSFGPQSPQASTPRLRDYFPETLVWQPSLETNTRGQAQLKFKLADSITTWKMSVIGSTADGQVGTVEKEFRAFQPFFVELDPPRILTEGDQISLPVVVRNYLERPQQIQLEIKPESWFSLSGPTRQPLRVPAGDSATGTFDLRAVSSVKDGKQRVTALGSEENDAIEKPVTVHPDGEELSVTASDILTNRALLEITVPNETIKGSAKADLKLYPSLLAHVVESVEAIMSRPYGCGEQTISSTYPSLLLLQNRKQTGVDFSLRPRAERYLQAGYDRLLNYNHASGGFGYWSKGEPDLALTAYALRFLTDAQSLIAVDKTFIDRARGWLIQKQQRDGSWLVVSYGNQPTDKRRTALLTAYIARTLALTRPMKDEEAQKSGRRSSAEALNRSLAFLTTAVSEIDEPYLLASYALASLDAGETTNAEFARTRLRSLAHYEGATAYWALETNTPFYGWGLAGRVETTALVVQALSRQVPASARTTSLTPPLNNLPPEKTGTAATHPAIQTNEQLIRSGLLFLLRAKDRYGVWYSTQATINVLDTMLAQFGRDTVHKATASSAEVFVNGQLSETLQLPPTGKLVGPILLDVSKHLQKGRNEIEIRRVGDLSPASVQLVASYYVPWLSTAGEKKEELRLSAQFNKTEGKIGEEITCNVKVERVGFTGYGMLLAEIGLPPGVDVDRASLDEAITKSNWAVNQYDVLPDRVVLYLWPRAGGVSFDFKFRPRFGLQAKAASSTVYDYYNPEARTTVSPAAFTIK